MKRKQMMSEDKEDSSGSSSEDDYDPRYLTREQRVALARERGGLMMLDMREREGYYASSTSAARPKRSKFNRKDSSRIVNLEESKKRSKEECEQHEKETESEEGKEENDEENKPIGFEKLQKIKKDDGNRRGVDRIVPTVSNVTPDTIIYCQTSGAPIIKNKPLPCCTVFLKCPPCIEEARFRNFSNDWAGKVSNYQKNGLKMENFTSTRPYEFSVGQTVYETFRVHKMIMPRFRRIEDQINKGDFTNLTNEEVNVYNVRYGIIREDNRIKFSNIVRGGKIIQYFWQTDANVQEKPATAVNPQSDRENPISFTRVDNSMLPNFSSLSWWMSESLLEPMASHNHFQETHELSIHKVLVDALIYLESNPFDQEDFDGQINYLKKMFGEMKCSCHFTIEQANRLSPHFALIRDELVKYARCFCVEHPVDELPGREPSPKPVPNQIENVMQIDDGEPGEASGEEQEDDSGEEFDDGSEGESYDGSSEETGYASGEESVDGSENDAEDKENDEAPIPAEQQQPAPPRRLMDIMGDQFQIAPVNQPEHHQPGQLNFNYDANRVLPEAPIPAEQQQPAPPRRLMEIMGDQFQIAPANQPEHHQPGQLNVGYDANRVLPGLSTSTSNGLDVGSVESFLGLAGMGPAQPNLDFVNMVPAQPYVAPVEIPQAQPYIGALDMGQFQPNLGALNMGQVQPNLGVLILGQLQLNLGAFDVGRMHPNPGVLNLGQLQLNLGALNMRQLQPNLRDPNIGQLQANLGTLNMGLVQSLVGNRNPAHPLCPIRPVPQFTRPVELNPAQPGQYGVMNYLDGEPLNKRPRLAPWNGGNL